jgi:uncharacterized repeat protein (TIGR03803 family)
MKPFYFLISALFLLITGTVGAQEAILHNFNDTTGSFPISSLTLGGNKLYGVTSTGGDPSCSCGTIFSINTNGTGYQDLHNFGGIAVTDGNDPVGKLVLVGNRLYGMTDNGQAVAGGCNTCGMIFSINTDGTGYRKLYNFGNDPTSGCEIGCQPYGSLTLSGNLFFGMANGGPAGQGVIFSIDTNGTGYHALHQFSGTDGANPFGSLTLSGSMLYGMTSQGGAFSLGCIFSFNVIGNVYDTLMSFNGATGSKPLGSLTLSGNRLYGMTEYGNSQGYGNIFSIKTDGSGYKDLRDYANAENPQGDLALSVNGNILYGMTSGGGINGYGSVFSIDTNGTRYNDLLDFCSSSCNDSSGTSPQGDLTLSGKILFGMTYGGGKYGEGVIFRADTANLTASVNELVLTPVELNLYPNPTNGTFQLAVSNMQLVKGVLEIYNAMGEKVYSSIISSIPQNIHLDTPSGIYFLQLKTNAGITNKKFIIQK